MRAALFVRLRQSSPSIRAKRAVPPHFQEEVSRLEAAVAEVDATPEESLNSLQSKSITTAKYRHRYNEYFMRQTYFMRQAFKYLDGNAC
jgi:hypothetical protein